MFSYIRRLGLFLAKTFKFQYFVGGGGGGAGGEFRNNEQKVFVDNFGGSSQTWAILWGHFYAFFYFSIFMVNVQKRNIFSRLLKFQIFSGMLIFLFFGEGGGGNKQEMLGPRLRSMKKCE